MKRDIPETPIGSTVKVHYRIIEGEKERIQIFEGIVIARKRAALRGFSPCTPPSWTRSRSPGSVRYAAANCTT